MPVMQAWSQIILIIVQRFIDKAGYTDGRWMVGWPIQSLSRSIPCVPNFNRITLLNASRLIWGIKCKSPVRISIVATVIVRNVAMQSHQALNFFQLFLRCLYFEIWPPDQGRRSVAMSIYSIDPIQHMIASSIMSSGLTECFLGYYLHVKNFTCILVFSI